MAAVDHTALPNVLAYCRPFPCMLIPLQPLVHFVAEIGLAAWEYPKLRRCCCGLYC